MIEPSRHRVAYLLFRHWHNFFAFGLGSGMAPIAPGTAGTLAAIPFYLLLNLLDPLPYFGVLVVFFLLGIRFCATAATYLDCHDHPAIVWDEMVGLWITLCFIPFSWDAVILGFLLFRLFDIAKPFPIGHIDRKVHGGIGIMLDDVIAGIFANVVLWILLWGGFLPFGLLGS